MTSCFPVSCLFESCSYASSQPSALTITPSCVWKTLSCQKMRRRKASTLVLRASSTRCSSVALTITSTSRLLASPWKPDDLTCLRRPSWSRSALSSSFCFLFDSHKNSFCPCRIFQDNTVMVIHADCFSLPVHRTTSVASLLIA